MMYQTAKSELQSPPHGVPLVALAYEAGAIVLLTLLVSWII